MFLEANSMERTAWMRTIKKPIPSALFLNLTESHIYFFYPGQERACVRCGATDHKKINECETSKTTKPEERRNAVHIDMDSL